MKPVYMQPAARQLFLIPAADVFSHPFFAEVDERILVRFKAYHAQHPELLDLYVQYAREAAKFGRRDFGIAAIAERLRWHLAFERKEGSTDFKINNSYRSCYARLISIMCPDLENMFEFRVKHKGVES